MSNEHHHHTTKKLITLYYFGLFYFTVIQWSIRNSSRYLKHFRCDDLLFVRLPNKGIIRPLVFHFLLACLSWLAEHLFFSFKSTVKSFIWLDSKLFANKEIIANYCFNARINWCWGNIDLNQENFRNDTPYFMNFHSFFFLFLFALLRYSSN